MHAPRPHRIRAWQYYVNGWRPAPRCPQSERGQLSAAPAAPIVVEASSPGFAPVQVRLSRKGPSLRDIPAVTLLQSNLFEYYMYG